jgi:hypothetical protein
MGPCLDLLLQNGPDRKVQGIQVQRVWQIICQAPEFRHVFSQELLSGPGSVGRRQILQEDVVAIRICPLEPEDYKLPQKVLINVGVDLFTGTHENDQTFLAIAAHHPKTI